ncbi:LysR family transcriptional regulator [Romboutsia sp.]|uniref:LysR family transcriptional regulator n=1 Tax=Romboutsia sp. TaxID=1965302 RepID=UPI003F33D3A7
MRIDSLRYFYEVAELKSISKVSGNLHISQPALSHQLSKLEKDLDVKLFERSNKGVELTNKGKILYNYAKQILLLHDSLIQDIEENSNTKKEIKINILNPHANFLLERIIKDMGKIFKNLNISISSKRDTSEKALLIHNRADVVVGCKKIDDVDLISNYIGSDKLILVSRCKMDYESIKDVSVALLEDNSNIKIDDLERLHKINICLKTDSLDVIKSYLQNTNVAAIVPQIAVNSELESGEFVKVFSKKYEFDYDLFITYRKDIELDLKKKLKTFKKELENILNEQGSNVAI